MIKPLSTVIFSILALTGCGRTTTRMDTRPEIAPIIQKAEAGDPKAMDELSNKYWVIINEFANDNIRLSREVHERAVMDDLFEASLYWRVKAADLGNPQAICYFLSELHMLQQAKWFHSTFTEKRLNAYVATFAAWVQTLPAEEKKQRLNQMVPTLWFMCGVTENLKELRPQMAKRVMSGEWWNEIDSDERDRLSSAEKVRWCVYFLWNAAQEGDRESVQYLNDLALWRIPEVPAARNAAPLP